MNRSLQEKYQSMSQHVELLDERVAEFKKSSKTSKNSTKLSLSVSVLALLVKQQLLLHSVAICKQRGKLADLPRHLYQLRINLGLRNILDLESSQIKGIRLQKRYGIVSDNLFLKDFSTFPTDSFNKQVPRMNNLFRRYTNCFWLKE